MFFLRAPTCQSKVLEKNVIVVRGGKWVQKLQSAKRKANDNDRCDVKYVWVLCQFYTAKPLPQYIAFRCSVPHIANGNTNTFTEPTILTTYVYWLQTYTVQHNTKKYFIFIIAQI
jgi:hypothetical protein